MTRIRKVTDLRTGLLHPRRDWDGRFMSHRAAAVRVQERARTLNRRDDLAMDLGALRIVVSAWNKQAAR